MGLDITCHEKISLIRSMSLMEYRATNDDDNEETTYLYGCGTTDGIPDGFYRVSGNKYGFRAGSYGGYNEWRANLARMLGTTDRQIWRNPRPGAFVELIDFSDCEGFLGPKACAKLASDFAQYREMAVEFSKTFEIEEEGVYFLRKYDEWARGFEVAGQGGCVHFH